MTYPSSASTCQDRLAKTAVIIPARNEERSIGLVLEDLPDVGCVIVVNNGSTDETARIARSAGCVVVDEPIAGYGRACLAGMQHLQALVREKRLQVDFVGFVDADFSDHPQELTQMMRVLGGAGADGETYDFILGSRMLGPREPGAMLPQALFGNWLACQLMRILWGTRFTDLGPFRLIRYDKLMSLGMQDLNFGWTIEMQIKAKIAGLRIVEVPTPYRKRVGDSKISGTVSGTIRAGYKILFTIGRYAYLSKLQSREFTTPDSVGVAHGTHPSNSLTQ